MLATAFATIALSSLGNIRIGNIELQKAGILEQLTKKDTRETHPEKRGCLALEPDTATVKDTIITIEEVSAVVDTLPQRILIIGDSMLEGLSPRLAAYAEHNSHKLFNVIWYSSTSKTWGTSTKLEQYISQFKPTYIFISLGANEMFIRNIIEQRDKYVKNILAQIGEIPYVWIGPPNWKDDTGINELIGINVPAERFFLSKGMQFERASDNVHPTRKSAAEWMDSIVNWMKNSCSHRINLETPEAASAKPDKTIILKPEK